ncbi:MAG TPA: RNA-binding protein [Spirochaetaceae bacterium]|jgi:RNA recognition motif-containing protein|nr:RNA-binding protein [Spirochaetaceae bacterium]
MSRKIYVGNLNYATDAASLRELFSHYGRVCSVELPPDPMSGMPRGFAFIEMQSDDEAEKAIEALNGSDYEGRKIRVNSAQERAKRPSPQR